MFGMPLPHNQIISLHTRKDASADERAFFILQKKANWYFSYFRRKKKPIHLPYKYGRILDDILKKIKERMIENAGKG